MKKGSALTSVADGDMVGGDCLLDRFQETTSYTRILHGPWTTRAYTDTGRALPGRDPEAIGIKSDKLQQRRS